MKRIKLSFLLISIILPILGFGQKVIKIDNVDLIAADDEEIYFFERMGDKFKEIYPEFDTDDEGKISVEINKDNRTEDSTQVFNSTNAKFFYVNQIQPLSLDRFKSKLFNLEWEINLEPEEDDEDNDERLLRLKQFKNGLFMTQEHTHNTLYTHDKNYEKHYEGKRWEVTDANFFNYCVIDLGNNRRIIIFLGKPNMKGYVDINGYIIPTAKKIIAFANENDFFNAKEKKYSPILENSYELYETIYNLYPDDYYIASETNNEKYKLVNIFDDPLLTSEYDDIFIEKKFIIAQKGKKFILYNAALKKLPLSNVRSWHLTDAGVLQILQGNKLRYIDIFGGNTAPFLSAKGWYCSRYTAHDYTLDSSNALQNQKKQYILKILLGGTSQYMFHYRNIFLQNLSGNVHLSFMNKTKEFMYTSRSEHSKLPNNWLFVEKDNKYGIMEFNLSKTYFSGDETPVKTDSVGRNMYYKDLYDTLTQVLPILYDIISVEKNYNYPLRIYKNGLTGYYPVNKEVRYAKLGERNGNFVRFSLPNGRKGWLDMQGNEFLDQ